MSSIPVTSFEWIINMHIKKEVMFCSLMSQHTILEANCGLEHHLAKSGFNFSYIYYI